MRGYLAILRIERMPTLLAASIMARLPLSINGLAIILFLREQTGSFTVAGATAGAAALGIAIGAVLQSRLIDRRGVGAVVPLALIHALVLVGLVVGSTRAPVGVLVVAGLAVGLTLPPMSSVLRAQYPSLLARDPALLTTAFALDAVVTEATFITGPLVVAAFATTVGAGWALVGSAVAVLVGTLAYLVVVADMTGPASTAVRSGGGALRAAGVVTLTMSTFPFGFAVGALEISIPAFAHAVGAMAAAGLLLALFSVASAAGGLAYGARRWRSSIVTHHQWLSLLFPLALLIVMAATSAPVMALLLIPAAIFTGPLIASRNELTGRVARRGAETEAYTWPLTALYAGAAVGAAATGPVVEGLGWRAGVLMATAVGALGSIVVAVRHRSLAAAV